ncbi:sigma 54-interacting transcriptional regulator, partial [Nitrospira sp. BLG_2]|uniref:sigma 54-interacting transcriptional regulator n=1 Tax=Nitrospira sp. BLG_2 TaxID=3397507 RepID=UPI003B99BB63
NELFGHEKGAFTGATKREPGKIEIAEGGTLFLDEIGDMPLTMQSHLVKTVARDRSRRFILEPSICLDCGFMFRDRKRLTRPSRCPHCRSEGISAPRYGIDLLVSGSTRANTKVSRRRDTWKGLP